jgi:signal transduction histidine kinase
MEVNVNPGQGELPCQYLLVLRQQLEARSKESLHGSHELGRHILWAGTGVLQMVGIHRATVRQVLEESAALPRTLETQGSAVETLMESVLPQEMTEELLRGVNLTWRKLNERMESEAKRIAHALHAETGRLLATTHIALTDLAVDLPPRAGRRLQSTRTILDQIEEHFRRMSDALRPGMLDDPGLVPAVEDLAEGVWKPRTLSVKVECRFEKRLSPGMETALYRLIEEALRIVIQHAHARNAGTLLWSVDYEEGCSLQDTDVDSDAWRVREQAGRTGLGRIGMRERLAAVGRSRSIRNRGPERSC